MTDRLLVIGGATGRAVDVTYAYLGLDGSAVVAGWILHAPTAHPFWSWYSACVIHLRGGPGLGPATKRAPEMTHELLVAALHPDHPPVIKGFDPTQLHPLRPPNHVIQFTIDTDAQASQLLELAMRACVNGRISPDSDWRAAWETVVPQTARCIRDGGHGHGAT